MLDLMATLSQIEPGWEMLKGGGLLGLLAYVIYSDRAERRDNREADVKRSEAQIAMAGALKELANSLSYWSKKS